MKKLKLIITLVLLVLMVVVFFQNRQPVTVQFLFMTRTIPSAVLIGISLVAGVVMGLLYSLTVHPAGGSRKKAEGEVQGPAGEI